MSLDLEDMCDEKKEGLEHLCSTLQVYLSEENCDFSHLPPGLDPINLLARVSVLLLSYIPLVVQSAGGGSQIAAVVHRI